ncbi:Recombination rad52 protein [Rutstroemia sp. NJR-2017a BBW]|nr:Recombination rad52 protein [Rutstroemia sp. NJR-2017a BBW]
MPAPGDQHNGRGIANPFEEVKPRISEYTAQEIATLQSRLEKQLGPEYISSRSGPSGAKVHYITAEKCIQLANEVFGFNGWSSQIIETQVDFVDEIATTLRVSLGLSVIVRVTLRDGTFHEDVGYGHIENCKGKAAAFEKAKKEGTTDALKRALRNFGNVLGNCIYDKDYLSKVTKIKAPPVKWDVDNLHRHSTVAQPVVPKQAVEAPKVEEKNQAMAPPSLVPEESMDDEFGDFDEADFSVDDSTLRPDEVALPAPRTASHHFNNAHGNNTAATNGGTSNPGRPVGAPAPSSTRGHPLVQPNRPPEAGSSTARNNHPPQQPPRTPNAGLARSASAANANVRQPQELNQPNRPINLVTTVPGRILNQPNRPQSTSAPPSPTRNNNTALPNSADTDTDITDELPPPGAGFFSARAANLLPQEHVPEGQPPPISLNLPAFNPNLESPSIRRTPGIDQKSSKPLAKNLKPVTGAQTTGAPAPLARPVNIVNPQLDSTRRIGAPGMGLGSPVSNRNSYKPLTVKRPIADVNGAAAGAGAGAGGNRAPLVDLQTNGPVGTDIGGGGGSDAKRQRLSGHMNG